MPGQDHVVFSDNHGRPLLIEACHKRYGDDVTYVSNGDAVDMPEYGNVKATIELLQGIGAICLYGNHEWVLSAVMHNPDEHSRYVWADVWSGYHSGVLKSYGLPEPSRVKKMPTYDMLDLAERLKVAIDDAGHTPFFSNLRPYYETDQFIAVHGGATKAPWFQQKAALDQATAGPLHQRHWDAEPVQIFDSEYKLSTAEVLPPSIDKVLLTGHAHNSEFSLSRMTDNNRRGRLAGQLMAGSPLFVWESWTGGVVSISAPQRTYLI
jgi:hypothetical protein